MKRLTITQAKPNPAGKDTFDHLAPAAQIAGEWVDFKNTGNEIYTLNSIELFHIAYTPQYPNGIWEKVTDFFGDLGVNEVVRVHSGGEVSLGILNQEDVTGADHHVFTGNNYV